MTLSAAIKIYCERAVSPCRGAQMVPGGARWQQLVPDGATWGQVLPAQMLPAATRCFQMLPDAARCSHSANLGMRETTIPKEDSSTTFLDVFKCE